MKPINQSCLIKLCLLASATLFLAASVNAQTTQFTYQGKLADSGAPASGQYDFQFKLFDTATLGTGTQQGSTVAASNVTVTAGIFTVQIDFGAGVFPAAANRFLEIALKPTSGSTFITLSPRQPVTANPYAIRSLNATSADGLSVSCVNCVTSSQIQSVQGSQLTGSIAGSQISGLIPVASVPSGSANYIQNTTSQQSSSNFNISGNGTAAGTLAANVVNAATQYNIAGTRVLSNAGSFNLFAGLNTGNANTGTFNSFFGSLAGTSNTTGSNNSFFGALAGQNNTTEQRNSFFGQGAGSSNVASENSFFGYNAGAGNTTGINNSFFGMGAGANNTTGYEGSFFGWGAGNSNTVGTHNSFFGHEAGTSNTTGGANTFLGTAAGSANSSGSSNTFIGRVAGALNTTGTGNVIVGGSAGLSNRTEDNNTFIGFQANGAAGITNATALGAFASVTTSNTMVLGNSDGSVIVEVPGKLQIDTLGAAGSTSLCLNSSNRVATCSSSFRYKTEIAPFTSGLQIIDRLRPISFTWKTDGSSDLGLGAEEVEKVEPLLTFRNSKGEIEGVKYDRINVVLINALKEQQTQIESQQKQIESLKKLVCLEHPNADACK